MLLVEFLGNVNALGLRTVIERHQTLGVCFYPIPRANSQYELKTSLARCLRIFLMTTEPLDDYGGCRRE